MPTCWSCEKVKGKRICPARGGDLICSRCCGTKRQVEILCPADCPYLEGAHDAKWTSASRQKEEGRFLAHFLALPEKQATFLFFLHHVLASSKTSLTDNELEDVLAATRRTLQTEQKGIVYQHHTELPHLEPVAKWLSRILAARAQVKGAPPATDGEVDAALAALGHAVKDHGQNEARDERYLDRAKRILGALMADAPAVELPDDLDEPPPPTELIVSP